MHAVERRNVCGEKVPDSYMQNVAALALELPWLRETQSVPEQGGRRGSKR